MTEARSKALDLEFTADGKVIAAASSDLCDIFGRYAAHGYTTSLAYMGLIDLMKRDADMSNMARVLGCLPARCIQIT